MIKNGFCKKKKRAFKEKSALAQSVFEQERLRMHFSNVVNACISQKCAISSPARLVFISDCYLLLILKARTASESSLTVQRFAVLGNLLGASRDDFHAVFDGDGTRANVFERRQNALSLVALRADCA